LSEPSVIVMSAPSGAGKSTVLDRVLQEVAGLRFSVSHTTRAPRLGETEGVHYHFVDRDTFESMKDAGALLEWAKVHGELYGTGRAELESARRSGLDLLLDLDVQGAAQVRVAIPDAVSIFLLPPSYEALEKRLRGRGADDETTIERRLARAAEEVRLYRHYDYAVVNDDMTACVAAVSTIIGAARCRTSRAEPRARRILETFHPKKGD
jgi:guanylate kinase